MNEMTFTSRQVIAICRLSQRQLSYWRRTALVTPSGYRPGGHAHYSFADLVIIRTIKQLIDAGVSLQRIRKSIARLQQFLPTLGRPLTELTLVATGDVILVLYEGTAFEALSGQEWIFPIADLLRNPPDDSLDDSNRQQNLFNNSTLNHSDNNNRSFFKAANQ